MIKKKKKVSNSQINTRADRIASAWARKAIAQSPMIGQGTRKKKTGYRTGGGF